LYPFGISGKTLGVLKTDPDFHSARFPENLPPGWRERLKSEADKEYFQNLTAFLRDEYKSGKPVYPAREKVLRALQGVDYESVKVLILGQDPYHGPGQAVGLCFAVPNDLRPKPPSLMNIFKEIEKDLGRKVTAAESELSSWVKQGVLLLNTVLTVRQSEAFSHRDRGWEVFTDRVIELLNERPDPVVFILWGAPSRKKKALITNGWHHVVESAHPSPLSAYKGFFGSRPFSKTNSLLQAMGKEPVDWHRTN
jgi:uracil-DNA glycosylase